MLDVLDEDQVFRIDHYLGKETVQNMLAFRFANGLFEPIWNRNYIDYVQITAAEDLGIGTRAGYYDSSGALRDLVQNHMLQLLTLLCMEPPVNVLGRRGARREGQGAARDPPADARGGRARWRCARSTRPGIVGRRGGARATSRRRTCPADSTTETYAALRLEVDNWRWAGVPIYLRTGKRLARKVTEIAVTLKPVPHLAFKQEGSVGVQPNQLILTMQPNEGVSISLGAKIPGTRMRIRPVNMEFLYGTAFLSESPEAYERLIMDAMRGDATLFTRDDEVEAQWRICDPILEAWSEHAGPAAAVRGRLGRAGGGRRAPRWTATRGGRSEPAGARRLLDGGRLDRAQDTTPSRDRGGAARPAQRAPRRGDGLRPGAGAQPGRGRRPRVARRDPEPARAGRPLPRLAHDPLRGRARPHDDRRDGHDDAPRSEPAPGRAGAAATSRSWSTSAPQHLKHLDTIVDPLVVSDLATVVWSPHGHHEAVDSLLGSRRWCWSTRSTSPTPPTRSRAPAELAEQAYVVDLAWLRSTPWRERIAATFDPQQWRAGARADQLA